MDNSNNFGITVLKMTILLSLIIWIVSFSNGFDIGWVIYLILLMIPIAIFWALIMFFTIMPFFWFHKKDIDKSIVFKRYFPFYSIITFLYFSYVIIDSKFENYIVITLSIFYFALMQSWCWLCKINSKVIKDKIKRNKN